MAAEAADEDLISAKLSRARSSQGPLEKDARWSSVGGTGRPEGEGYQPEKGKLQRVRVFNTAKALGGAPSKLLRMKVHRVASGTGTLNPGADSHRRLSVGAATVLDVDGLEGESEDESLGQPSPHSAVRRMSAPDTLQSPCSVPTTGGGDSAPSTDSRPSPFPKQLIGGVGIDGGTPPGGWQRGEGVVSDVPDLI
eukprot:3035657-Prymnesium_polylepis.1